jgi:hypothetical protein
MIFVVTISGRAVAAEAFHRPYHRLKTASIAYDIGHSNASAIGFHRPSHRGVFHPPYNPYADGRPARGRLGEPAGLHREAGQCATGESIKSASPLQKPRKGWSRVGG